MSQQSHKEAALEFLRMIGSGNIREAYRRYVSPEFRHHNPYFPGDADSLMAGMEEDATRHPRKALDIRMVFPWGRTTSSRRRSADRRRLPMRRPSSRNQRAPTVCRRRSPPLLRRQRGGSRRFSWWRTMLM